MFSISCLVKNFSFLHKSDKYTIPCSTNLFIVSIFMPRSCFHLDFILVYSVRHWSMPSFRHTVIQFAQEFLWISEFLCQNLGSLGLSTSRLLYSLPSTPWFPSIFHLSTLLFLSQYQVVLPIAALQYNLRSGRGRPPSVAFLFISSLDILDLWLFQMNSDIIFPSSRK